MDIMNDEDALILIAPYQDLAVARRDFANLRLQLRKGRCRMREAVLVIKNAGGTPEVLEISAHHIRTGAGWGAGIGALCGLLIPPIVASVAVGAAAGALATKFVDRRLKSGLRREVGEALAAGSGVVLAIVKPGDKSEVEKALAGASGSSVLAFSDATITSVETAIADVMTTGHHPDRPQPVAP